MSTHHKHLFAVVGLLGLLLIVYAWYQKQLSNAYAGGIDAGQKSILGF